MAKQRRVIKQQRGIIPVRLSADQKRLAQEGKKSATNMKVQGKANRSKGDATEDLAHYAMNQLGLRAVNKLVNEFIPLRNAAGDIHFAKPGRKRPGDFYALTPKARGVLIEVKSRDSDQHTLADGTPVLRYSTVARHQHEKLAEFAEAGGLSLVIWVHNGISRFFQYPHPDFVSGKSLNPSSPQFKPQWQT